MITSEGAIRWAMFPLNAAVQLIVVFISLLFYPIFKLREGAYVPWPMLDFVDKRQGQRALKLTAQIGMQAPLLRDHYFYNDMDDHGALNHWHLWHFYPKLGRAALKLMQYKDGSLYRRYSARQGVNHYQVSGEAVVGFCAAHLDTAKESVPKQIELLADHIIANAFGMRSAFLKDSRPGISARASWFGIFFARDGSFRLAPPAFGPQVWTCLAPLAYAASGGKLKYKIAYAVYFILSGAWAWAFMPLTFGYEKKIDRRYYTDHVAVTALYVLNHVHKSWFYRSPMRKIVRTTKQWVNPFFYGLMWHCGADQVDRQEWSLAREVCLNFGRKGSCLLWQRTPDSGYWTYGTDKMYAHVTGHAADLLMTMAPDGALAKRTF